MLNGEVPTGLPDCRQAPASLGTLRAAASPGTPPTSADTNAEWNGSTRPERLRDFGTETSTAPIPVNIRRAG